MIKVNLARRRQTAPKAASSGTHSGVNVGNPGGGSKSIQFDGALKTLPFKKLGIVVVLAIVAGYVSDFMKTSELKKVDDELAALVARKPALQAEANKMKTYNELKKTLDADEFTIRTKIDTIRKLINDRSTPSRLLLSLAKSMPEEVWFTNLGVADGGQIRILGIATGLGSISDFMRSLGVNPYFTDLSLKNTQQVKDSGSGVDVTNFELTAKRKVEGDEPRN